MSNQVLISDTSAIIILSKIDKLNFLNTLFDQVIVTSVVKKEFGEDLPEWIKVENPIESNTSKLLNIQLDPGEASAISLALEKENDPILLIDERKGRKIAKLLHLKTIGTLGVLLLAKREGLLLKLKPTLNQLAKFDFRISDELYDDILDLANEK